MTDRSSGAFARALAERNPDPARGADRRWVFVPYDQLTDRIGPLSRERPEELGIVVVECPAKAARRPYHRQKLALVLSNLRHFALEQAERGVAVLHHVAADSYAEALREIARGTGPLRCMRPAELELRHELEPLVREGTLEVLPHEGWLTTPEQFDASQKPEGPWRMDAFYRRVRRDGGWLMEPDGKPTGGRFSFDDQNREPWKGDPPPPAVPELEPDGITLEVVRLVESRYAEHPGRLDPGRLPASQGDAERLWDWARRECLPHFGPYEDAMSSVSSTLFHTRVSSLLNLCRLLPGRLVEDVLALDVELRCKEGFVRQVLGWREFVRHVHERTRGFRELPGERDGEPDETRARPNRLESELPLPRAYWGAESGLACLDGVVRTVWEEGYSHHITRLMILSNLATLLDVSPRELTDWFWAAYTDAYDWVVEPNVLGMGTFATGDLMTTKPYVSGAAYIHRMGDSCGGCRFDPKRDCPITPLYWAFLERHRPQLEENPRLRMPYASLRKRSAEKRRADAATFEVVVDRLRAGQRIEPEDLAEHLS